MQKGSGEWQVASGEPEDGNSKLEIRPGNRNSEIGQSVRGGLRKGEAR